MAADNYKRDWQYPDPARFMVKESG